MQVENIALLSNAPQYGFVGVNMYVDDEGSIKELPVNLRASDIANCCAKPMEVGRHVVCQVTPRSRLRSFTIWGGKGTAHINWEETFCSFPTRQQSLSAAAGAGRRIHVACPGRRRRLRPHGPASVRCGFSVSSSGQ